MPVQLVVLAGGFGTRLKGAIADGLPKPMAPIAGKPFLVHLLDRAIVQGVDDVILLVGYKSAVVADYFGVSYRGLPITYSYEDTPLGTGGAIKAAAPHLLSEFVLVNGDTFVDVSYRAILGCLGSKPLCMSLASLEDVSRYGSVITESGVVVGLREKGMSGPGVVNAGVYGCGRDLLDLLPARASFSFEVDFLEQELPRLRPRFVEADSGIIDIGTPESYAHGNAVFSRPTGN
ncbi:MAG: sugar phosphate nucleotidyltransferase [Mycobacterium sp.]|nr:sugar phosphate nucleotidyltransferase [Mycobacterium sp.]